MKESRDFAAKRWTWENGYPYRRHFANQARSLGHGPIKTEAVRYGEAEIVRLTCARCGGEMHFGRGYSSSSGPVNIRDQRCDVMQQSQHFPSSERGQLPRERYSFLGLVGLLGPFTSALIRHPIRP